jgi:hypothetical protein
MQPSSLLLPPSSFAVAATNTGYNSRLAGGNVTGNVNCWCKWLQVLPWPINTNQ